MDTWIALLVSFICFYLAYKLVSQCESSDYCELDNEDKRNT